MKEKRNVAEQIGLVFFGISLLMLAVSVFLCFCDDIWYDEVFTMGLVQKPLKDLFSIAAKDVHPPLYYLLLKLLLLPAGTASQQVILAKLLSVLPMLLCIVLSYMVVRRWFGTLTAGLFSFLLLAMPQLAGYSVEIRMYSLSLLLVTAAQLSAYKAVHTGKRSDWLLLSVLSLLACYTHYFACIAAVMVYVYAALALLERTSAKTEAEKTGKKWRSFWLSGLLCAVLYLPWLLLATVGQLTQVSQSYWIQGVSLRTLFGCAEFLLRPSFTHGWLSAIAAVTLFAVFSYLLLRAVCTLRKKEAENTSKADRLFFALGCLLPLIGILLAGFFVSLLVKPIFVYRYMIPAAGCFWLSFSILLGEEVRRVSSTGRAEETGAARRQHAEKPLENTGTVIFLLFLLALIGIRNYRAFYGEEMYKRVQMTETRTVLASIPEDAVLLYNFGQLQAVISWYLPNESNLWYEEIEPLVQALFPQAKELVEGEFSDEAGIEEIRQLLDAGNTVYFLGSGNARDEIAAKWEEAGISVSLNSTALLERYWFNLYVLSD